MFDNFGDYPQDLSSPRSSGIFHQENEQLRQARSPAERFSPISPYFFPQSPGLLLTSPEQPELAEKEGNIPPTVESSTAEDLEQLANGIKELKQAMEQMEKRISSLEDRDKNTRRDLDLVLQWKSQLNEVNPPQGFYRNVSDSNQQEQQQQTFYPINFSDITPPTPKTPAPGSTLESIVEASGIFSNSATNETPSTMEENQNNQAMETEQEVECQRFDLRLYVRENIMEMKAKQGKKNIQVRSVLKVVREPLVDILKEEYNEDELTKIIIEERVELKSYGNTTPSSAKSIPQSKKRLCRSPSLEKKELALIASIKKDGHNSKLSHAALAKIIFIEYQKRVENGDAAFHERSLQQLSYRLSKLRD